jgi:transcriptional regulator with GAF, ATPase, and Fis domain
MSTTREQHVAETFVELADTLVDDFDVIDLLHILARRCTQLLNVTAAGIMLADVHGTLQVAASSVEEARLLELYELQNDQGPCLDCYRTGQQVVNVGAAATRRWPEFTTRAEQAGYASAHALPMRLRGQIIGTLNLFRAQPGELEEPSLRLGQALADVATISLLQQRSRHDTQVLASQLQNALTSRIVIEQAKGILAERRGVDLDTAFSTLRGHARDNNQRLADVARSIAEGGADPVSTPATRK